MKCPSCGENCAENDKFCRNCGAKLPEANPLQAEVEEAAVNGKDLAPAPDLSAKGKIYKYSLKVIFCVFTVLTFLLFLLPVDGMTGVNVYRCAAAGNYGDGLDGRWETSVFIIELLANMFSNVDLVLTPCAFMFFLAFSGACLVIVWVVLLLMKKKPTVFIAEAGLLIFYALFAVADIILICGLKHVYHLPVGAAPVALIILTAVCFVLSLVIYVKRKKFFRQYKEVASTLKVS